MYKCLLGPLNSYRLADCHIGRLGILMGGGGGWKGSKWTMREV